MHFVSKLKAFRAAENNTFHQVNARSLYNSNPIRTTQTRIDLYLTRLHLLHSLRPEIRHDSTSVSLFRKIRCYPPKMCHRTRHEFDR